MAQAKSLTDQELKIVLAMVAQGRHAARNRMKLLLSHLGGMRVGEIAAVKIGDVLNPNGTIVDEIRLTAEQTKGSKPRTVYVSERLKKEIAQYLKHLKRLEPERSLIYSQKGRDGFTANSLGQQFKTIYRKAGIQGASSHSGRRTFITTLANKGIGVRVLQALAGHASIATTQIYIDVNDEMKRAAVNLL
jgi:integrase/recombinase XerD